MVSTEPFFSSCGFSPFSPPLIAGISTVKGTRFGLGRQKGHLLDLGGG